MAVFIVDLYLQSLLCSVDLCVYSFASTVLSYSCSFIMILKIGSCEYSNFILNFQNCFDYACLDLQIFFVFK